jgi:hypothetical protein
MKKSPELTAAPDGVATVICPEARTDGALVVIVVEVEAETGDCVAAKTTWLSAGVGEKFVPVMVTLVPEAPIVGVKLVIVGGAAGAPAFVTVNDAVLVAEPLDVVTVITPVVALPGTLVTIWVVVATVTVADVPLNVTVF